MLEFNNDHSMCSGPFALLLGRGHRSFGLCRVRVFVSLWLSTLSLPGTAWLRFGNRWLSFVLWLFATLGFFTRSILILLLAACGLQVEVLVQDPVWRSMWDMYFYICWF